MVSYSVGRVPIERTLALRKAVLRPHLPATVDFSLPDDFEASTVAFAALASDSDRVLSVARVTPEPPPLGLGGGDAAAGGGSAGGGGAGGRGWRLRGMATDPDVRSQGVGAAVLAAALDYCAGQGGGIFWCNARVAATNLYARAGLQTWGEIWEEPEIGPHIVMWRWVAPA